MVATYTIQVEDDLSGSVESLDHDATVLFRVAVLLQATYQATPQAIAKTSGAAVDQFRFFEMRIHFGLGHW